MFRKLATAALLASVVMPFAGGAASAEQLKVVASFSILGDFAARVGGDRIELTTLVGPDGDAHVYEPRPADAAAIAAADVVLVNGLGFETFIPRLVEASGGKAPVVELTKGVATIATDEEEHHHEAGEAHEGEDHDKGGEHAQADEAHDHDHEKGAEHAHGEEGHDGHHHDHGPTDPHAFQSVPNAIVYVGNIAEAFCAADAAGCESYRANASAYAETLKALDAELRASVERIPADKRVIITSHDAFAYLGKEYGLTFLAPEGVSTASEASAADVARLIDQVREDKASALFVENVTNARLIEQIGSETGIEVGGALYSDALSDAGGPAPTYVDMMRHNIGTIAGAIRGS